MGSTVVLVNKKSSALLHKVSNFFFNTMGVGASSAQNRAGLMLPPNPEPSVPPGPGAQIAPSRPEAQKYS